MEAGLTDSYDGRTRARPWIGQLDPANPLVNVPNVRWPNVVDVNTLNRLLAQGEVDRQDMWPRIVEYESKAAPFPRELSCGGHQRLLLSVLSASLTKPQPKTTQIRVRAERAKSLRTYESPALVIRSCLSMDPDWAFLGTNPK